MRPYITTTAKTQKDVMTNLEAPSVAEVRLQNLTRLMNEKFDGRQSNLARAISRKPDYIWRVLNRQKGFGETLARDIEKLLSLPAGWLDNAGNSTSTGEIPAAGSQIIVIARRDESGISNATSEEDGMPIRINTLLQQGVDSQAAIMVVQGDQSMSMSIPQGEQVLVNTRSTSPIDGKLFYLEHGRMKKIRRLAQESNGVWNLRCDTHDKMRYPDTQVPENELGIIGQVFWSSGRR